MDAEGDSYFDKEFNEFLQGMKESSKEDSDEDDKITTCMLSEQ